MATKTTGASARATASRRTAARTSTPRKTPAAASAKPPVEPTAKTAPLLASTGAPSPYALAELVTGRSIDWSATSNPIGLLENIFDMPYTDLIGAADSPLFYGSTRRADGSVTRKRPDVVTSSAKNDAEEPDAGTPDVSRARTLADLVKALGSRDLDAIPVRGATLTRGGVFAELGGIEGLRTRHLESLFDQRVIDVLFPQLAGYHPPGFSWQDTGRFYNETSEFFDPVQGQVADCYFIAAMSSVAWSQPYTIADRTRATAAGQDAFTHQVSFFGPTGWQSVEVTDRVLVASGGSTSFYAHSSEGGEIWPAIYEKAFAKWRFGTSDDFPNIPDLAWGDTVAACVSLTGGSPYYRGHDSMTAAQVLTLVQSHSSNGRTTTPMVSWSYGQGSAEATRAATEAGVVASHAYSVLGWMRRMEWVPRFRLDVEIPRVIPEFRIPRPGPEFRPEYMTGGADVGDLAASAHRFDLPIEIFERYELRPVDYIVLRNPWGSTPGTGASAATGDYTARDVSWWRSVPLGANGVFALEVNAYRRYFAGTGGAD